MTNFPMTRLIIRDINCYAVVGYKLTTTRREKSSTEGREKNVRKVGVEVWKLAYICVECTK